MPIRFSELSPQHRRQRPTPLISKDIAVPDLRAGFAYVLAALIATDESNISGVHYLDPATKDWLKNSHRLALISAESSPSVTVKPLVKAIAAANEPKTAKSH